MNSGLAILLLLTVQITGTVSQNSTNATTIASTGSTMTSTTMTSSSTTGEAPTPDWVIALIVMAALCVVALLMGCCAIIFYRMKQQC